MTLYKAVYRIRVTHDIPQVSMIKYLAPRRAAIPMTVPLNLLMVEMSCAPMDTLKRRWERRKEKMGVMAPERKHVTRPKKMRDLRRTEGICCA
jgi:hypothetical protein